jgi:hypothetical protein
VFRGRIGNEYESTMKRLNKVLTSSVEREFLNEINNIGLMHLVLLLG